MSGAPTPVPVPTSAPAAPGPAPPKLAPVYGLQCLHAGRYHALLTAHCTVQSGIRCTNDGRMTTGNSHAPVDHRCPRDCKCLKHEAPAPAHPQPKNNSPEPAVAAAAVPAAPVMGVEARDTVVVDDDDTPAAVPAWKTATVQAADNPYPPHHDMGGSHGHGAQAPLSAPVMPRGLLANATKSGSNWLYCGHMGFTRYCVEEARTHCDESGYMVSIEEQCAKACRCW